MLTMFSSMFCLLITLVIQAQCEEVVVSSSAAEQQLRVISSLTKAITYMNENNDKLNLDAITGLRIIQGQLDAMKREKNPQINELHQLVIDTIELALPAVISYEPAYYKQLARLVDNDFWQSPLPVSTRQEEDQFMKNIVEQLLLQADTEISGDPWSSEELFDETLSDHCIQQLINKRCNISLSCVNMMTAPGAESYAATHQVYYFIIMIQAGCVSNSTQAIVHEITNSLCAAIYMQAMSEPKGGDIAKDLFMEQVGLCGLAGYSNLFSRHDWVDMIISWQRPEGCFGNMENFLSEIQNIDERDRFKRSSSSRHGSALTRVKREERIMNDGCLCHRTTVAALALIQNYKSLNEITSANQIFKDEEQKPQHQTIDGRPEDILQKLLG